MTSAIELRIFFQLAGLTLIICEQRLVPGSLRGFDHENGYDFANKQ
jgi:hypothetical protein